MKVIEKNATVYKAIRVVAGERLSWMAGPKAPCLPPPWTVKYRRGRWAHPTKKGTALFAFKDRPPADWIKQDDELWLATADIVDGELSHGGQVLVTWLYNSARSLVAFWRNPAGYSLDYRDRIKGAWCSRIRLEERLP